MLLTILKALIALHSGFSPDGLYPNDYGPNLHHGDEFDFIVVGGGTAGALLANRLTEVDHWNVLLLEAGGHPSKMSEIPALAFSLQQTEEDWQYILEPSKSYCVSSQNQVCQLPRGRVLGGSSTINLMMYTRSTRYDHERWTKLGNEGWDFDSIVKYYKKFENLHIENNRHYGEEGELRLTRYTCEHPIRQILANGYRELGFSEYDEDKPIGFRDLPLNVHEGTRQNAAKTFLAPVKDRKNLFVAIGAQVSRILLDPDSLRALGVEVKVGDEVLQLKAKNEVVLSAGSINSPQILMNSGIGPEEHLRKVGIKVLKNLRVGDNFQDHVGFPFVFMEVDASTVISRGSFALVNELYQYFANRKGALSNIDITNFAHYSNSENRSAFSNLQYVHGLSVKSDPFLIHEVLRATNAPDEIRQSILERNQHSPVMVFFPILLHPRSSGTLRLRNRDPFSKPLVYANFFSDPRDVDVILEGIRLIERLAETEALAPVKPKLIDLHLKNCEGLPSRSDEFWRCAIQNAAVSAYHASGTCKMGPSSDPTAVVDPQLKVHGVKGLRVVDASIIPVITSSNTNAPTMMIAERGAELIKQEWMNVRHDEL